MKRIVLYILLLLLTLLPATVWAQEEFKEWVEEDTAAQVQSPTVASPSGAGEEEPFVGQGSGRRAHEHANFYWVAAVILFTALAGVLVRFKAGRVARPFFLVASIVVLGFYHGGCPCPVGGFQETMLYIMGYGGRPGWLWWFVALLPLTYFLGKVWCGWVCHLGALQELLYRPGRFHFLASARAQRVMRYIRIAVLVALLAQLGLTHHLWWREVDPFKTAFNLMATNPLSWVLLGVLLVSSVLMYRPFCKTACPVGLVLGWISKIPGAAGVGAKPGCIGCKACSQACHSHALTWDQKTVVLDRQECIACGECLDACPLHGLGMAPREGVTSVQVLSEGKKKEAPVAPAT